MLKGKFSLFLKFFFFFQVLEGNSTLVFRTIVCKSNTEKFENQNWSSGLTLYPSFSNAWLYTTILRLSHFFFKVELSLFSRGAFLKLHFIFSLKLDQEGNIRYILMSPEIFQKTSNELKNILFIFFPLSKFYFLVILFEILKLTVYCKISD